MWINKKSTDKLQYKNDYNTVANQKKGKALFGGRNNLK